MRKTCLICITSVLWLLAGCSSVSLLFVDTEKLAREVKELETLIAVVESDDQLAHKAVRKYFAKHSLSPVLDTSRPIVIQKDILRIATGKDLLIVAACQQDQSNYYAAFSILKRPSENFELTLLYLTHDIECLISPELFLDILRLIRSKIATANLWETHILIEQLTPKDSNVFSQIWTLFKGAEKVELGVLLQPDEAGGTVISVALPQSQTVDLPSDL